MAYYRVCPNCGSNLDPGEQCDCERQGATETGWNRARERAAKKRERIIEREGSADGERQKPYYTEELTKEAVSLEMFLEFTFTLSRLCEQAEENLGIKKEQPVSA